MKRTEWTQEQVADALEKVANMVWHSLQEKGKGAFASRHEALGIIQEEMTELEGAVTSYNAGAVEDEFVDLAVAAILSVASRTHFDW